MPDKKISELDSATINELSDPTAVVPVAVPDDSSGVLTTKKASVSELGSTTLDGLTDVDTTGVTSGQVLKYNGAQWAPGTDNTGGGGTSYFTLDGTTMVSNYGTVRVKTNAGAEGGELQIEFPPDPNGGLRTGLNAALSSVPMDTFYDQGGWYGIGADKVMLRLHNHLAAGYHLIYDQTAGSDGALHVAQWNGAGWNAKHLWSDSHVGDDPPSDPVNGTMWYDTSAAAGYVYVDSLAGWIQFNATTGASSLNTGWRTSDDQTPTPEVVDNNKTLTFNHNLGTDALFVQVQVAEDDNGSGNTLLHCQTDFLVNLNDTLGAMVKNITNTTIDIDLGHGYFNKMYNQTSNYLQFTGKYIRVLAKPV